MTLPSSRGFILSVLILILSGSQLQAEDLKPLMNIPDKIVYESDFSKPSKLDKTEWQARQGTRWEIKDGLLKGQSSTPEFQASKPDHKGYEPRVANLKTPQDFIAKFSVRFIDGTETNLTPLVEFGHHNVRLKFGKEGVQMLGDHEAVKFVDTKEIKLENGKWYHLLAERHGDEVVIQFQGGPTFYAKHESFKEAAQSGADGLGIAGTKNGQVEIDNVTVWSIKSNHSTNWPSLREKLPQPKIVEIATKKKK